MLCFRDHKNVHSKRGTMLAVGNHFHIKYLVWSRTKQNSRSGNMYEFISENNIDWYVVTVKYIVRFNLILLPYSCTGSEQCLWHLPGWKQLQSFYHFSNLCPRKGRYPCASCCAAGLWDHFSLWVLGKNHVLIYNMFEQILKVFKSATVAWDVWLLSTPTVSASSGEHLGFL